MMTPEQVLAWVESTYGIRLSEDQIRQLAGAIGFTGDNWSPQMAEQAMNVVRQVAQDNNIPPVSGGSPSQGSTNTLDLNAARQQVLQAVQQQYGYALSDAQLQGIWDRLNRNSFGTTEAAVSAAMRWLQNPTNQNVILQIGSGGAMPAGGQGSSETPGGGSGGGNGGGGNGGGGGGANGGGGGGGGNSGGGGGNVGGGGGGGIDMAGAEEFKKWFRQTFGREATGGELANYASGARYAGGAITPRTLAELKDLAIVDQKAKGWLPVGPNQFQWSPFEYQEFQYAEQAPQFGGMEGFRFDEQAPTYQAGPGFEYQQFAAPNMEDVVRDPAYKRRLEEGQKALQTSAAAKGLLRTGATLKGLTQYGQELASEEYGKTYERAKGEYDQGYRLARDKYQSAEDQRQTQYAGQRQSYLDRLQQAQFGYQTEAQRRSSQYGADTESWRNRYNQAFQQYQTNRASAETAWNAKRQQDLLQWQRDYDVWRYLSDDPYRKAQIAAMNAGTA